MKKYKNIPIIIFFLILLILTVIPEYVNAGYRKKTEGYPSFIDYIEVDSKEDLVDAYRAFGEGKVYKLPNGTALNNTTEFAEAKVKVQKEKEEAKKKEAEEEAKKNKESGTNVITKNENVKEPYIHYPETYNQEETVFIYDLDFVEEAFKKYPKAKFQAVGVSASLLNSKLESLKTKKAERELEQTTNQTNNEKNKEEITSVTPNDIITYGNNFINSGKDKANANIDPKNLQALSSTVYNVLLVTGIVIALIVGMILGIKFIIGSVEEQAEIKKALVPYIVGCVVVFGAFAIWKIVVNILQSV